jgi:hypothetical protein
MVDSPKRKNPNLNMTKVASMKLAHQFADRAKGGDSARQIKLLKRVTSKWILVSDLITILVSS